MSEIILTLRKIQPAVIITVYRSVCTVPVLLSDFDETLVFSTVSRNIKTLNLLEIFPVGAYIVHGAIEGQTERDTDGRTGRRNEAKSCF